MRILIAPNAFKNSLPADAVAEAIRDGLQQSALAHESLLFPVGDGGDGTGTLITRQCNGETLTLPVVDPLGRPINAAFGIINNGHTAVIEMAAASGLRLLQQEELDPLRSSSYGTGLQVIQALDKAVTEILLCVGGSATVDGGCGLLQALGFQFLDHSEDLLTKLPAELDRLSVIDDSGADKRLRNCTITVLCDVRNQLSGDKGAAAVFGPQKGATPAQVQQLDAGLRKFARIIHQQKNIAVDTLEHGGAAGGVAAGLYGLLDAKLVNGIDHFLQLTGFVQALHNADLVITGEGSLDRQTLEGKAPFGVATRCRERSVPVIAMAGQVRIADEAILRKYFDQLICINKKNTSLDAALAMTRINLVHAAEKLGDRLAKKSRLQL
jgi:glycerate kinase